MEPRISPRKPRARLHTGDTVLANAQALNMKPVKSWYEAFAAVHGSYAEAQRTVEAVEGTLAAEQAHVVHLDAVQDDAVEALALCLANDGQARANPFARFTDLGPGTIKSLVPDAAATAIHALVATLHRQKSLSPATLAAVRTVEEAALRLEAALPPLQARRTELKAARAFRDTIAQKWDAHLTALRLAVRGAEATAVPGMYAAVFGRNGRTGKRAKTATAAPETPPASPHPTAAESPPTTPTTPPADRAVTV